MAPRKGSGKNRISEKSIREMFLGTEDDILDNMGAKYSKRKHTFSCHIAEPFEEKPLKNKNSKRMDLEEPGRNLNLAFKADIVSLIVKNIHSKTNHDETHSNLTNTEEQFLQYYKSTDDPTPDNAITEKPSEARPPSKKSRKNKVLTAAACGLSLKKQEQKLRRIIGQEIPNSLSKNSNFMIKEQSNKAPHNFTMYRKVQKIISKYDLNDHNSNIIFPSKLDSKCLKLYISLQDTILFKRMLEYPGISKMFNSKNKNISLFISNTVKNFLKESTDQHNLKSRLAKEKVICARPDPCAANFLNTTNLILLMMFKDRLLDKLNYVIEETTLYILINATLDNIFKKGDENKNCMIKVFKNRTINDTKSLHAVEAKRKFLAESEMQIMKRMNKLDINSPQFIINHEHIIVMALPGSNDIRDLSLDKLKVNPSDWPVIYEEVIKLVRKLYEYSILIKGILSLENILWYNKKCWIRNVMPAEGLLTRGDVEHAQRDCNEIMKFFSIKFPRGESMRKIVLSDIAYEVACDKKHYYRGDVCIVHNEHCGEISLYREIRNMVKEKDEVNYNKVFIPRIFNEIQFGIEPNDIADYVKNTNKIFWKRIKQEQLASLNYKIYDGQKFSLLHASLWTTQNEKKVRTKCIVKIFKIRDITSNRHKGYLRKLAETEKENLQIMENHNVYAPRFIDLHGHVVFMCYPGDNNIKGRYLIDLNLKHHEWVYIYKQVTDMVSKLYKEAKLVSGRLSENTVLWYNNRCSFLNASECVSIGDYSALDRLKSDCRWINMFFNKLNVPNVKAAKVLYCSITGLLCRGDECSSDYRRSFFN